MTASPAPSGNDGMEIYARRRRKRYLLGRGILEFGLARKAPSDEPVLLERAHAQQEAVKASGKQPLVQDQVVKQLVRDQVVEHLARRCSRSLCHGDPGLSHRGI